MKKSELKSIIREEIKNVFEAEDPTQTSLRKALISKGAEFSPGGGNRLKEKEYNVYYDYRAGKTGDEEGDDEVTVTASSKEEAVNKAWEKIKNKSIVIKGKAGLRAFEKK